MLYHGVFCSCFVKTLLKSWLNAFPHTQNVLETPKRKISSVLLQGVQTITCFWMSFARYKYRTRKRSPNVFKPVTHFHPGHPWQKTRIKRQCPLRPSEMKNMWHMMKNQNSPFFSQRLPYGSSRNVVAFFVEKLFLNLQKIKKPLPHYVSLQTPRINANHTFS